ncbi:CspA family cold shock protein [Humitalea rosea]|uniref:CspA family cold shock protein n=1 Tax=Humitalea rosea TaxID=990373 RepID=A0A2W7I9R2_9PROT|nr:CspA family cold shock protein [Humitalea rosea]
MASTGGGRSRRPRGRGGFDDDNFSDGGVWTPPTPSFADAGAPRRPSPFATGPEVKAVVKWFNPEKGFGFVEVDGGGGDAFLHASALERAGAKAVNPGAKLTVRVGPGQKGLQVTEVLDIADAEPGFAPAAPPRAPRQEFRGGPPPTGGEDMRATVKWYSAEKGFGFVTPESGGKDVFVHATALERSGVASLAEGQVVTVRVVQGKKGPEAASVADA